MRKNRFHVERLSDGLIALMKGDTVICTDVVEEPWAAHQLNELSDE